MTSLRELGERSIIRIIERSLGPSRITVVGFGDDVSAVRMPDGKVAVIKTDMLVGSTDVPPGMSIRQAASKAVVSNVSDLAAKGVQPLAGLVALGLPASLTKRDILELGAGLRTAAKKYNFPLVGGDTNESRDLTISITLLAITNKGRIVLRSTARPGDIVAVTGEFGSTSAGLKGVLDHRMRPDRLPLALYQAVFNPQAELKLGLRLAASGALTASIDSSDGLAWSLHQLSEASHVGMLIDRIPVSKEAVNFARRYGYRARDLALYGGEEYHLVVTTRLETFAAARKASRGKLKAIGVVTGKAGVHLRRGRELIPLAMRGWEHFRH